MEISILCSAIKVRFHIGSKIIDDFKAFSGFVLRALFKGYTLSDIDRVIGLSQSVVDEEIDYLRKIGFISDEGDNCSVAGIEFCTLMSVIDAVNDEAIDAYVELFSGKILPYDSDLFVEKATEGSKTTLAKKIFLSALYERDYINSKELVFAHKKISLRN